jgi:hypothetical protein
MRIRDEGRTQEWSQEGKNLIRKWRIDFVSTIRLNVVGDSQYKTGNKDGIQKELNIRRRDFNQMYIISIPEANNHEADFVSEVLGHLERIIHPDEFIKEEAEDESEETAFPEIHFTAFIRRIQRDRIKSQE